MQDKKINSRIYRREDLKNEIVLFTDGEKNIEVQVSPDKETVWLTQMDARE